MYHLENKNVVADALSCKTASFVIEGLCMRILIDSSLLDLIRRLRLKESRRRIGNKRLMSDIDRFATDIRGLLT